MQVTVEEGNTAGGYWVTLNDAVVGSIAVVMDFPEDVIGYRFGGVVFTQENWDRVAYAVETETLQDLEE